MSTPLFHFIWLIAGFIMGMFFMYNLVPLRMNQVHHLKARQTTENPILQFGNPGPVVDLLERTAYTTSFNRKDRIPYWVGEHLTADNLKAGSGVSRDKSSFTADTSIPLLFRVTTKDYTNSGYDRGHHAPAADAVRSQATMDESFLMTNIAPQVGAGFNQQYWAYLEKFCRDLTSTFSDVFVYTGPLFLPHSVDGTKYKLEYNVIGAHSPFISVPTHYYKIILVPLSSTQYAIGAFVLPNQAIANSTPLTSFQVDLQAIELASGLQFFKLLDRTKFLNLCDKITCSV
ncbi:nuclease [Cokeromyces recurvatus]|uniref:nuclease n=1 Tax=Cokeromyces recurvatus TaxID=90255 RepID=UPI002220EE82|nr:nuclease [Cokeromyces recurvatus]KAI7898700.1 nuclease [Cokeromyces recurvatus]